nr:reverse transcriptase domain-containing protein [Tanacetum cinerariifolium]
LTATAKGKQPARETSPTEPLEVERTEAKQLKIILKRSRQETHISQHGGFSTDEGTESGDGDAVDTESDGESKEEETREEEEETFDPIPRTPEDDEDDGNVSQDIEDSHVILTPVQPDGQQESSSVSSFVTSMLNPTSDAGVESIFTTASSPIAPLPTYTPIITPSTIATITTSSEAPIPPTIIPSAVLENLPTFDLVFCFEERVKSLEVNFSEFMQTNQFAEAVSKILGIVHQYITQQMMEAVREAVQIQTDRLPDSFQRENDEFLHTIDENMKKIIKGQVKIQVKEQVSCILSRIEEYVNAQLEAEVLTRSSNSSRTSYAVAADLTEMELKRILIEKMEGNKSIQRSDEQRNLYKALVDAYEADKTILESYGDTTILKRRRGDDDDQEGPSAGSDRGSKRRREGGEPEPASTPSEPTTRSAGRSTTGTQSGQMSASASAFAEEPHPEWFSQPRKPPTPDHDWNKTLPHIQESAQTWISKLAKQADSRSSFNELLDTPIDFSNFIMNRLGIDTLTPELLAGPTYELMRGHYCAFPINRESALDVYSKRRIIAVTDLKIGEWHNYKHLDWILVRHDDDKIYKFKEGNFKRLRLQDIEDMLLLLIQGKLSNLTVEERFAFNVSLRMFTRSIVIQRRVEDLQLGMNTTSTSGSGSLSGNIVANPKGKLKAITTRSGLATDGPTIPTPPKSVNPEEDECVEETHTDPDLAKYTIKALVLMPKYQKNVKALLYNKEKLQKLANTPLNENCSAVILKKLPEKLGDPGKFLILCGFSELKCKALADLGASINLMPLSVWKKLGLPVLIPTRMTLELANRAICTPDGIARDVFAPVGKFTFPADFVVVDYESDPRVPLILGRPFLRTARALIDVHGEEMILRDGDERLTLNMKHDTASYSNHPHRESLNLINIFNIPSEDCLEVLVSHKQSGNPTFSLHKELTSSEVTHDVHDLKGCNFLSEELPDIDSFNDIHPYFDDDPLNGSTSFSSNSLLEEFSDELALITYPLDYDDNLTCDIKFDLREIEFLIYQEIESDADNFDDDIFDSKGEKIKEFELLIDQLDLPCDIFPHSEYDSFAS